MKLLLFVTLFLSGSLSAADSLWHTFQAPGLKDIVVQRQGKVAHAEEVEGILETIVVDNIDSTSERYFVLRTRDGRHIDLGASGVTDLDLQKFSSEHPVVVRMQVKGLTKGKHSGLLLEKGQVLDVRQKKTWIDRKGKGLLRTQSNLMNFPKTMRVAFVAINIQGREENSGASVTQDVLDSFSEQVGAMTYGRVLIESSMDDVYHVNRPEMSQLKCSRGLSVVADWAMKRAFPNGKNYKKYDRVMIIYPSNETENCGWLGVTYVRENGLDIKPEKYFGYMLIRASLGADAVPVMVHEFGHTMGLWHSAMDGDGDGQISKYEEYEDPECSMARYPIAYNPINLKKLGFLDIGFGIEIAEDGRQYELSSPLTADPFGMGGAFLHPLSMDVPTPPNWLGRTVALKAGSFYINRSIEDDSKVYIRQHLPISSIFYANRGYETLVVGRVKAGDSFRFPEQEDGICVMGGGVGNSRLSVSYHATMEEDHVCPSQEDSSSVEVERVAAPSGLELVDGEAISEDHSPAVRVLGVRRGDLVRVYRDSFCQLPVGLGIAKGSSVDIETAPLPLGYHTLFARSGPSLERMSDCSSASVDYGVEDAAAPAGVILLHPLTASHVHDTPQVRVEGVLPGDMVRLYADDLCRKSISHPVSASGTAVDIETWPLPEGKNYQLYVRYIRAGVNLIDCWDSGLNYNVLEDKNRARRWEPSLEMPTEVVIRDRSGNWKDQIVSDESSVVIRVNPTIYRGGKVSIFTDSECRDQAASVDTHPRRIYKEVVGQLTVFDYAYVPVYIKIGSLELGEHRFYAQSSIGNYFSECSTDYAHYTLIPSSKESSDENRPEAPTNVTVSVPLGAASGFEHSPTFEVEGVQKGDLVRVHQDEECLLPLGYGKMSAIAEGKTARIQVSSLFVGSYTAYASVTRDGVRSSCSTAFASYEVKAPQPLPPKSIKVWGNNWGINKKPTILVGDEYGVYEYDEVSIYKDWDCKEAIGTDVADYNPPGDWYDRGRYFVLDIQVEEELSLGEHIFYAKVTRDGVTSDCSLPGQSYEVLSDKGNYNDKGVLNPPEQLRLVSPDSDEAAFQEPLIEVSGVRKSDTVRLFIDKKCTKKVGENIVLKKGSVKIRSNRLGVGKYKFYANRTHGSETSSCSKAFAEYTVTAQEEDS